MLVPEVRVDKRFLDKAPLNHAEEKAMWKNDYTVGRHKSRKPARTRRRFPPEVLTDDEVRALMDACGRYAPLAIRNRALIAILYRGGLRINEALALYPKDIDPVSGAVRVLHGKGDKPRTIGIDPGAILVLERWLAVRSRLGFNSCHAVFCTVNGSTLRDGYIRSLLPSLARIAGIQKRVHAHGLRHTHAAQLREEGVDIGIISKQLGHLSIATTARYLDHIAPFAVLQVMRTRTW